MEVMVMVMVMVMVLIVVMVMILTLSWCPVLPLKRLTAAVRFTADAGPSLATRTPPCSRQPSGYLVYLR
jgi:hypothetical protein